jgi:predicted  nucleic acid-binding Zn-ribbon protein
MNNPNSLFQDLLKQHTHNRSMTDKIVVACSRCRTRFRERVSRLRDGFQSQCPNCGCFVNFSSESMDPNILRAMRDARRIRNGFIADETEKPQDQARL